MNTHMIRILVSACVGAVERALAPVAPDRLMCTLLARRQCANKTSCVRDEVFQNSLDGTNFPT